MIDTHCHLLPGLDDGPADEAAALALARALVDDGVSAVVATPHWSRRFPTSLAEVAAALAGTRSLLAGAGVPLEVGAAAELTPARALDASVEELRRRAAGGRYVIIEAEPTTTDGALAAACDRVLSSGLRTIVAHPERCRALRRRPSRLDELRAAGSLVQVVAPSVVGQHGDRRSAAAWGFLEGGRVDLVASDAHDIVARPPQMRAAAELVERRLGASARTRLFEVVPGAVAAGTSPYPSG